MTPSEGAGQNHPEMILKTELLLETQPTKVDCDLCAKSKKGDCQLKHKI